MEGRQARLFEDPAFLEWLPDETLYSLCGRYRMLTGNVRSADTCVQLFGSSQGGYQHEFPTSVDAISKRMEGSIGSAESILRDHTLLGFYLPFKAIEEQERLITQLSGGTVSSFKAQLGLFNNGFGAAHPLKACPQCMNEDRLAFMTAYWHLSHQYPGSWICIKHKKSLMVAYVGSTTRPKCQWALPGDCSFQPTLINADDLSMVRASTLCQGIVDQLSGREVPMNGLLEEIRSLFLQRGLLDEKGKLESMVADELSRVAGQIVSALKGKRMSNKAVPLIRYSLEVARYPKHIQPLWPVLLLSIAELSWDGVISGWCSPIQRVSTRNQNQAVVPKGVVRKVS